MRQQIRVAFAYFWPGFQPEQFRSYFPYVYEKYDLVVSQSPDVVFHSVFSPQWRPYQNPTDISNLTRIRPGNYVRVFLTGENVEPVMSECEFAISFSALIDHPNHLRLPLWVYENRGNGFGPEKLVKDERIDWEEVARGKTAFCNYVYFHTVPHRDAIFDMFNGYKRVDAAGECKNNMNRWTVPMAPSRLAGKVEFFHRYKFTLAAENAIWPGYTTEKLVDPVYASSIPIYVGDPLAQASFDPRSYIDFTNFGSIKEMLEFVREVDNNRDLYLSMLAAPFYRNNSVPAYACDENTLGFFDRVFEAAVARRVMGARGAKPA